MSHYFRLFDIEKYRSIQPVIERIIHGESNSSEAIFLVDKALRIAGADEFNKYNNEGEYGNLCYRILERTKDLVEEGNLSKILYNPDNMLKMLILVICCPRFQLMTSIHVKEISDTHAEFTDRWGMSSLNEELSHILDTSEYDAYQLKKILVLDGTMALFNKEQLAKVELMVSRNIRALADKKYDCLKEPRKESGNSLVSDLSYMADMKSHADMVEFNNEFYTVLKLASSQPYYTVLSEYNNG